MFSSNNKLAFDAKAGNKQFIIVNKLKIKEYDDISSPIIFSPDGKKIAYIAGQNSRNENYQGNFIVIDDKEEKYYYFVGYPIFSPDSKNIVYHAINFNMKNYQSGKEPEEQFVVLNGKEGKIYDDVSPNIIFSPDSKKIAYEAEIKDKESKKELIVINDKEGKLYANIKLGPIFSPDSKKVAYAAEIKKITNNKFIVVVNEKESREYNFISNLTFSADSQKIMYDAKLGNELWWITESVN